MRIGESVIYIQGDQEPTYNGTREHPAVVTRVWGLEESPTVNLTVFFDNSTPAPRSSTPHHHNRGTWVESDHEHHGAYYLHEHEFHIEG